MTRTGAIILGLIVLAALAFGSMLSFGPASSPVARVKARLEDPVPRSDLLLVPVQGYDRRLLTDTWGQSRGGGTRTHQAIDIIAPGGTPVIAAAAGTVEKLFRSEAGGITAYVRSPDRGWIYYYAHLAGYAPGLAEGQRLRIGDRIGFVGDTGNAGAGNTHLHFAVARMRVGDRWHGGRPVNPFPLLAGSGERR